MHDADPCFLLKVIFTPDGLRRTAGTLTGAMYANPNEAMAASGCTVWTRNMFGDGAGEWHSDDGDLSEAIREWSDEIKKEVLLSEFRNGPHDGKAYNVEKEFELAPQRKIWIGLRK